MKALGDQADNIVVTNDVEFHHRARKALSHSFTTESLLAQHVLIERHASTLVQKLQEAAHASDSPIHVDMTDWLCLFAMDVIGDLAFGESFSCLDRVNHNNWTRTLMEYLNAIAFAVIPRQYWLLGVVFNKCIPQRLIDGYKQHLQFAHDRINRRLRSKSDRPDLMTPFLENNQNFELVSHEEILSTFNIIIVGGFETVATVLTGIVTHLIQNESILQRLCHVIRSRFQFESEIQARNVTDLPYLNAVIEEGLRMCHPTPDGFPRVVPPGGDDYMGVWLPGGTKISVHMLTVNRSEKHFTDPDSFAPERWLEEGERPARYRRDRLSASKPFAVGYHSCIGRRLAWAEMQLVLARLLWTFDIQKVPGRDVNFDDFPVIGIIQKQPVFVRLSIRNIKNNNC